MSIPTSEILNRNITAKYQALPRDSILAEYVWIGGSGSDYRCKTRTLPKKNYAVSDLPAWNFDGSSTGQAPGDDSEVIIRPVAIFKDPFRGGDNILVLCDCYTPQGEAIPTNTRKPANDLFAKKTDEEPWYGLEQEYTLLKDGWPLGWPKNGYPRPQGPFYCSAGADCAFGREVVEAHYAACLFAGIKVAGINAEVCAGQWEYQVGPCTGIESGDHMHMSRYILHRICEEFGVVASFEPKVMPGDFNGSGCHTNYSTKAMRADGGWDVIIAAIEKLGKKHAEHISVYGEGNDKRLTGAHETAPIDKFSYGVANRGASVRIPRSTEADKKGYLEDRRPASNIDPYVVTAKIFETTCL